MSNPLGVGIIGCGDISRTYLRLTPLFRGLEIRACADLRREVAEARAQAFGVRAETVDQLLADPEIDVVINLTIPDAHYAVTKTALEAGKHVYSEKPFVLSVEDGLALKALATPRAAGGLGARHLSRRRAPARPAPPRRGRDRPGRRRTCHIMSHGMESWHPNP
jgi:predicted dehydrogenase